MNVGFHVHYHDRDQTLAAVFMAEQLIRHGYDVKMLSRGTRSEKVHKNWDNEVGSAKDGDLAEWSPLLDTVIWTDVPSPDVVAFAKSVGVRTVVVAICDELKPADKKILKVVDAVASPTMQGELWLREKWELPRVFHWPIDLNIPPTIKPK